MQGQFQEPRGARFVRPRLTLSLEPETTTSPTGTIQEDDNATSHAHLPFYTVDEWTVHMPQHELKPIEAEVPLASFPGSACPYDGLSLQREQSNSYDMRGCKTRKLGCSQAILPLL